MIYKKCNNSDKYVSQSSFIQTHSQKWSFVTGAWRHSTFGIYTKSIDQAQLRALFSFAAFVTIENTDISFACRVAYYWLANYRIGKTSKRNKASWEQLPLVEIKPDLHDQDRTSSNQDLRDLILEVCLHPCQLPIKRKDHFHTCCEETRFTHQHTVRLKDHSSQK